MGSAALEPVPRLRRVLLVEDDPGTAELMRRSLERNGYSVQIAPGVQSGLEALRREGPGCFEALLLDYNLPDGEPWEVADAAQACVPEVPAVFVTAMSTEDVAIEALRRGFADFVKKSAGFWNEIPAVLERVARLSRIKGSLDESSALMGAVVEQSSDLVAVCSGDGTLVYLSPVCLGLLGRHSADLVGRPWTEIVAPEDRHVLLAMQEGLNEKPSQLGALRCRRKDGSLGWMEARVALLKIRSSAEPRIVLTLHDVTAQHEHERSMQVSLQEKESMLREIHHRVKNNLQVVQSLLRMRARTLPSGEARTAIETTGERVHAMAMVHERLYQMPDLGALSLAAYLQDLFGAALASSSLQPGQVRLELEADEIHLTLDRAVPFGLLANELVSNCLKHAFPDGRKGKVVISIHRAADAVQLAVEDDGVGLPPDFDLARTKSMGLKLASSFAHQLGGRIEFSSSGGCRVQASLTRI